MTPQNGWRSSRGSGPALCNTLMHCPHPQVVFVVTVDADGKLQTEIPDPLPRYSNTCLARCKGPRLSQSIPIYSCSCGLHLPFAPATDGACLESQGQVPTHLLPTYMLNHQAH